jgi:hypothetical protein
MEKSTLMISMIAALLLNAGCASTHVQGATQVGGAENGTWVYVQTSKDNVDGIYRCTDDNGRVICTKALLH